jgi:hypothetical protein
MESGSGPGGRRFKSSLPDHLFSARCKPSQVLKIPAVGKNATVFSSRAFLLDYPSGLQLSFTIKRTDMDAPVSAGWNVN